MDGDDHGCTGDVARQQAQSIEIASAAKNAMRASTM